MKTLEWYEVENTGWSGGISWFSCGGGSRDALRFSTPKEAIDYINQTRWDDLSVLWRYVHVTFKRNGNKEIRTREWIAV